MALVHYDGFEDYNTTTPITSVYMAAGSALNDFRYQQTGRYADSKAIDMHLSSYGNGDIIFPMPAAVTSIAVGASLKADGFRDNAGSSGFNGLRFFSSANNTTNDLLVAFTSTGAIQVSRGYTSSSVVLGTSAPILTTDTWFHIGVELVRHATAGSVTVYIDGVAVLALTGVNTNADSIDRVSLHAYFQSLTADDFYICDTNSWLGEARVSPLLPNADTAQKDFTPSTGASNYACIDEQPPSTTDYVTSNTVGAKDLYDIADLSYTPLNILGVKVSMYASKDEITTRTVRPIIKSGSTSSNGATKALSSSNKFLSSIWATDPNTGAAWTKSGVDALQVGMEIVA